MTGKGSAQTSDKSAMNQKPWDDLLKSLNDLSESNLARVQGYVDRIWKEEVRKKDPDLPAVSTSAQHSS
jgi:hypothetical protein